MRFYTTLLIFFAFNICYAQSGKERKRELMLIPYAAADINFNKGDIVHTNSDYAFVKTKDNISPRLGIELLYISKRRVLLSWGYDYSIISQQLNINYNASTAGYIGSNYNYSNKLSFTGQQVSQRFRAGYSFKAGDSYVFELSFGLNINLVIKGMQTDSFVAANINDNYYKDPVLYYGIGWGHEDAHTIADRGVGVNFSGIGQYAIRFIEPKVFNKSSLKVAIDAGYLLGGSGESKGEFAFLGANREELNRTTFRDVQFSIGLSVGVEL